MKTYTIKANRRVQPLSFTEVILNTKNEWCEATNEPREFMSPHAAKWFIHKYKISGPQLASDGMPMIIGPKGGRYSIFTGERYR